MTAQIFSAIRLTFACLLFLSGIYSALVWGVAQMAPNKGNGFVVEQAGKIYPLLVGQAFTSDRYFWSRPSAVDYNAAGSAGSNKGISNPDYVAQVQARMDTLLAHHPGLALADVPSDLVTASGSGLDPHISVAAAQVQIRRIAAQRNLNVRDLELLVAQHTEAPWLGLFGPSRVPVLTLNLALDRL